MMGAIKLGSGRDPLPLDVDRLKLRQVASERPDNASENESETESVRVADAVPLIRTSSQKKTTAGVRTLSWRSSFLFGRAPLALDTTVLVERCLDPVKRSEEFKPRKRSA